MTRDTLRPPTQRAAPDAAAEPARPAGASRPGPAWSTGGLAILRFPDEGDGEAAPDAPPDDAPAQSVGAFLVADDAADPASGQMRKSDFLNALFNAVCDTARAAITGGAWNDPCPTIEQWFGYYENKSVEHIEGSLRKYAPEASGAESAAEYVPILAARVRRGIAAYLTDGSTEGLPDQLPAGGVDADGKPEDVSLLAAEGGGDRAVSPARVQSQLGRGEPMEAGVRGRMESAFGADLSGVRLHSDTTAADLSGRLDARAFTLGSHVAFGAGEYQPGHLMGDALLAHELAHVMQQRGGAPSGAGTAALEENADRSAESAVASLWTGASISMAHLRSGLSIHRCSHHYTNDEIKTHRGPIQAAIGKADTESDNLIQLIDDLGKNADEVLVETRPFTSGDGVTPLEEIASTEGGRKVLARVADALSDGDLVARHKADQITAVLTAHSAAPPAVKPVDQVAIDRINNAINADPRISEYSKVTPPLKLPVQLHRFDVEDFGGVYYDPFMPKTPPGDSGITTASALTIASLPAQYPLIYIRLGPLALSHSDEYLRETLWHEFTHYKSDLEFRKPEKDKTADVKTLEGETGKKPNSEVSATSIGLVDYLDKLSDDEILDILRYLAESLPKADANFHDAAIERIRAALTADKKKEAHFLTLLKSMSPSKQKDLADLIKAIEVDVKPPAKKPAKKGK